jgi:hypothetical protein
VRGSGEAETCLRLWLIRDRARASWRLWKTLREGAWSGRCFYGEDPRCGPWARWRYGSLLSGDMLGQRIFLACFKGIIWVPRIITPDSSHRAFQGSALTFAWRLRHFFVWLCYFLGVEGSVFDGCARAHQLGVAPKASKEWLTPSGAWFSIVVGVMGSIWPQADLLEPPANFS